MHITIATVGSRGDVQPYIALGKGLRAAGHSVCLATHVHFEQSIRSHGLDFSPVVGDPRATVESELGQRWLKTGTNIVGFLRCMAELMQPMMAQATGECLEACSDADIVLYSVLGFLGAHSVAEKLEIPGYAAFLQPATPTKHFPSFAHPIQANLGGLHNKFTHISGEQVFWIAFRRSMNHARHEVLNLPPEPILTPARRLRKLGVPVFYGYSPTVMPKPPDWPQFNHVCGYWFLDRDDGWEPPTELSDFLGAGPPPVYIGFGSMHTKNADKLTETVVQALDTVGLRGVIHSGWGALSHNNLPDTVLPIGSVPHDWLFPRMAAVVHHGGAGTTAAGLRAGVPSIITPFFGDQFFWSRRVAAIGAGPRPIAIKNLTPARLAKALRVATEDTEVLDGAARVGEAIRDEDGVARVVEVLGSLQHQQFISQH